MEHRMHVFLLVQRVEHGTGDVANAFGNNPNDGCCGYGIDKGLEGYEHTEAHAYKTNGFEIGMFLQSHETDDGASHGAQPYKSEEPPSPITLFAKGYKWEGRIAAGYMPVDGSVVPAAQPLSPF